MHKPTQTEINETLQNHAEWLKNPKKGKWADFSNMDLTDANLYGAKLTDANLSYANLTGANLENANLENAKFNRTWAYRTKSGHCIAITSSANDQPNITIDSLDGLKSHIEVNFDDYLRLVR